MEVRLPREQEAQLNALAAQTGRAKDELAWCGVLVNGYQFRSFSGAASLYSLWERVPNLQRPY